MAGHGARQAEPQQVSTTQKVPEEQSASLVQPLQNPSKVHMTPPPARLKQLQLGLLLHPEADAQVTGEQVVVAHVPLRQTCPAGQRMPLQRTPQVHVV